MGSIAFSDVIQLKSLFTKCKTQKVTEMVQKCGDNTVDLHVQTKVPAGTKKDDEQIWRLHASSLLVSYSRLE